MILMLHWGDTDVIPSCDSEGMSRDGQDHCVENFPSSPACRNAATILSQNRCKDHLIAVVRLDQKQYIMAAPWRCISRGRWWARALDLRSQPLNPGFCLRMMCSQDKVVDSLSSCKQQPWPPAAHEVPSFPRPSSVPFQEELVNTVHLIGKLEGDVRVRMLAGRQAVANVCLAVQKSADPRQPPSWFDLLFWGALAKFAGQHLKKGDVVHVAGKVTVATFLKTRTVRKLNFVKGSGHSGAAMAHRPSAETQSSLSQQSGNNEKAKKLQRRCMDHHPKHTQRFIKLHPKKEEAIKFGHSMKKLETMLKQLENGKELTSQLHSRNNGWEAFKRYCKTRWHVGLGATFDVKIA